MRTSILATLAGACLLLGLASQPSAGQSDTSTERTRSDAAQSGTSEASVIVRISYDERYLPLEEDLLNSLLRSAPIRVELGQKWRVPPDVLELGFSIKSMGEGSAGAAVIGEIHTLLYDGEVPQVAAEIAHDASGRLEHALLSAVHQERALVEERSTRLSERVAQAEEHVADLTGREEQVREELGGAIPLPIEISDRISGLQREIADMELELRADRAREEAITHQIAKVAQQVEKDVQQTEVTRELHRIVELRERAVAAIQAQAELASEMDLTQALERLASARAEFARYREEAARHAGGDTLDELNRQLIELAVETAETDARMDALREQLEVLRSGPRLRLANEYHEEVRPALDDARDRLRELREVLRELETMAGEVTPPSVRILGGD